MFRTLIALTTGLCLTCALHGGDAIIAADDFDDDAIGPLWTAFTLNPPTRSVVEQNQRLELAGLAFDGDESAAGLFADGWTIDITRNFRCRIDWRFEADPVPFGEIAIELVMVLNFVGDPADLEIDDAIEFMIGRDANGPFRGHEVTLDGITVVDDKEVNPDTTGRLYVWYDAATDVMSTTDSALGFDDPSPDEIPDVRASTGSKEITVALVGFSADQTPAISGADSYGDDFLVLAPSAGDLDGDFTVGFNDLLLLLVAWGPCPGGCPEDLDGDEDVDFQDLLFLLTGWD